MRWRSTVSLTLLLSLGSGRAWAAPGAPGDLAQVILPDKQAAVRELLAPLLDDDLGALEWRGPSINFGEVEFWLMRDGEARAVLRLEPKELATADARVSESFAIEVSWVEGAVPEAREEALMTEALSLVQDRDRGGFYVTRRERPGGGHSSDVPIHERTSPHDPATVKRSWWLELSGVMLLGFAALGVTFRRRPK